MSDNDRPIIGLTMGDPAGIGPEIIIKTLNEADVYADCRPLAIGWFTSNQVFPSR